MLMEIIVKKWEMVKPAEETPRRSVWLSEPDLLNNSMHTPVIYFYNKSATTCVNNSSSEFFDADVIKKALARVLVHFYPVAGRLGLGPDGRLEIHCNGEGALFVEAQAAASVADFGDFAPSPDLRRLFPTLDYSAGVSSYPLLVAQVTYFRCGGVSLGIAAEHRVVDGPSTFHLINSWSQIARGMDLKTPPFLDRTILSSRDPPRPMFNHIEYQITTPTAKPQIGSYTPEKCKISLFTLTNDQLSILKTKAKDNSSTTNYTTFEVLAGHIWKCTLIARGVPSDQETRLYLSVSGKYFRFRPPLPIGYFGNAVFTSVAISLAAGDIQSKPYNYAASCVKKTLARMDNDYLRSAIDYLKLNKNTIKRYADHNFRAPNLTITSWIGMRLYDADFGWGQPFYIGPGDVSYSEGKATIFPSRGQDGGLQVVIALQNEHMKVFQKLFYEFDEARCFRNLIRAKL